MRTRLGWTVTVPPDSRVVPARFYSSSAVDFHANRRAFPAEDAGQLERLARALSGFLYGVSPMDPLTFALV